MKFRIPIALVGLLALPWPAAAQLKLPSLLADHMVLQQGKPLTIWGWNIPGDPVNIRFAARDYKTITNAKGEWQCILPSMKAGAAGDMVIASKEQTQTIHDILIGEVWVCSGQSNMEWLMSQLPEDMKTEPANCRNNAIRYLTVKKEFDKVQRADAVLLNGWRSIDSNTLGDCSSVAYYFARKLYERLKVPIGLLVTSWGGTPAQAWADTASIRSFPNYYATYRKDILPLDFQSLQEQVRKNDELYKREEAATSIAMREYISEGYDDARWADFQVPKFWEDQGYPDIDGVGALRFRFSLTEADLQGKAILYMPAIDDVDSTWINGKFVGTGRVWNEPRRYEIPASVLKAGTNTIALWILDTGGAGGLFNEPNGLYLQLGEKKISLSGPAKFKLLATVKPLSGNVVYSALQNQPSVLFNAMIHPLLKYSIRGAIWYQGESNVDRYVEYRKLFPAMIESWRKNWKQGDFPFLFAQLASFNPGGVEPAISAWAGLREAQSMTLRLPNTGMAVTTDVGDLKDIHPRQKRPVGERLALNAFRLAYGFKSEVYSGPVYASTEKKEGKLLLRFTSTGNGLMIKGDKLEGFAIAGADKKFVPADAVIRGDRVQVSSSLVKDPVYVRYAWANAPLEANLFNNAGLPAVPFRTDKD